MWRGKNDQLYGYTSVNTVERTQNGNPSYLLQQELTASPDAPNTYAVSVCVGSVWCLDL